MIELAKEIAQYPPSEVLFWSGAGTSTQGPAALPTAGELSERVADSFFEPAMLATVLAYHELAGWRSAAICAHQAARVRLPRVETMLAVAARENPAAVLAILDDIRHASPNWTHRFFAAHLRTGGGHVTANFDRCVENAYQELYGGSPADGSVHHFHQAIGADTTAAGLGAMLATVESGFQPGPAEELVSRLATGVDLAVIVGYSGGDFVDVDRAFAALKPDQLRGLRVIWITHGGSAWHQPQPEPFGEQFAGGAPELTAHGTEPPLAGHLRRAGASVAFHCGPTADLLAAIQDEWKLAELPPSRGMDTRRLQRIVVSVDAAQRRRNTFRLSRVLGLLPETERLLQQGSLDVDAEELRAARADLLWEQGRWGELRRWWRRNGTAGSALRAERIGACLGAQGRLLPAYLWLRYHQRRRPASDPAGVALLAGSAGRVIEAMVRTPDLAPLGRWLARRRVGTPAGTSLPGSVEGGNLRAALSQQQRHYRDSYQPGALSDDELTRRYRAQVRRATVIGSTSAWWMLSLPGAPRVFSFREAVVGAFTLQFAPWQRVRLLTRFALRRTGHRLSRSS